jgi:hypothetical protein
MNTVDPDPPLPDSGDPGDTRSGASKGSNRFDENEDLLSDYTSDTTFYDEEQSETMLKKEKEWQYTFYRSEGRVHIFGEWTSRGDSFRYIVIGPDSGFVFVTYALVVVPSVFIYLYLLENLAEKIVFFILFGFTVFGLTTVFIADPGLVRKYHHARSRHWTYCDHCESFRPPNTVHCSQCQVCVAGYDHHCPVSQQRKSIK